MPQSRQWLSLFLVSFLSACQAPLSANLNQLPQKTTQTSQTSISKYNQTLLSFQKDNLKSSASTTIASLSGPSLIGVGTSAPSSAPNTGPSAPQSLPPTSAELVKLLKDLQKLANQQLSQLQMIQPPAALLTQHNKLLQAYQRNLKRNARLIAETEGKEIQLADLNRIAADIIKEEGLSLEESAKQSQEIAEIQFEITRMALKEEIQSKLTGPSLGEAEYRQKITPSLNTFYQVVSRGSTTWESYITPSPFLTTSENLKSLQMASETTYKALETISPPERFQLFHYTLLMQIKACLDLSLTLSAKPTSNPLELFKDAEVLYAFSQLLQISSVFQMGTLSDLHRELENRPTTPLPMSPQTLELQAQKVQNGQTMAVKISWPAVPEGVAKIELFRYKTNAKSEGVVLIATQTDPKQLFLEDQDPSLTAGEAYTYAIRMVNAAGEKMASGETRGFVF